MSKSFANDFYEILPTLSVNPEIRSKILFLIENRKITGRSLEEEIRKNEFRNILKKLVTGEIIGLDSAISQVQNKIPRNTSKYRNNNQVFSQDWAERLIRIQLSRFYNQAVMEMLIDAGKEDCFIPHSKYENNNTLCTTNMAGKNQKVRELYRILIEIYENENNQENLTIPQHPNCTHVVKPID